MSINIIKRVLIRTAGCLDGLWIAAWDDNDADEEREDTSGPRAHQPLQHSDAIIWFRCRNVGAGNRLQISASLWQTSMTGQLMLQLLQQELAHPIIAVKMKDCTDVIHLQTPHSITVLSTCVLHFYLKLRYALFIYSFILFKNSTQQRNMSTMQGRLSPLWPWSKIPPAASHSPSLPLPPIPLAPPVLSIPSLPFHVGSL